MNNSLEPYVSALRRRFGVPSVGSIIEYSQIDEVLEMTRSFRGNHGPGVWRCSNSTWYSIVGVWKDELRQQHFIETKTLINRGFLVLNDNEKTDLAGKHIVNGTKRLITSNRISSIIPPENLDREHSVLRKHYHNMTAAALKLIDKRTRKIRIRNRRLATIIRLTDPYST